MTVPISRIRPLLGLPSRWSQRPLRHTETLRLTEPADAVGRVVAHAHTLSPGPATPAVVARLHRGPAVLAEVAAETGLPLGVVATVCQTLVEAGVIGINLDHDRTGPRKVAVVAPTLEQERSFVAAVTAHTPALLCMDHLSASGDPATVELAVSRAVRRPDWAAPLCLMGTPRRVASQSLWSETLRDAAALVLLVGPDSEEAVRNALAHAPADLDRLAVAPPPWTPVRARRWLAEADLPAAARPTGVLAAADVRLTEEIARLAAPDQRS